MAERRIAKTARPKAAETIELRITVPRRQRIAVGLKGEVEVDFSRLSRPLLEWLLPTCLDRYFQNLASGPRRALEDVQRVIDAWYAGFPNYQARQRGYPRFDEHGLVRERAPEITPDQQARLREAAAAVAALMGKREANQISKAQFQRKMRELMATVADEGA